ncbi:MAG: DUF3592 domain-containing protein [Acidobacteriaceae bacterium]
MEGTVAKKADSGWRKTAIWTGWIAGAIFLLVGAGFAFHTFEFLQHSVRTTGTVLKLIVRTDSHGELSYTPVFEFTTRHGGTYATVTSFASNPPLYVVGQKIPVLYEPGRPETASPDSFWILWFFSILFFFLGMVVIGSAMLLRVLSRRRSSGTISKENS